MAATWDFRYKESEDAEEQEITEEEFFSEESYVDKDPRPGFYFARAYADEDKSTLFADAENSCEHLGETDGASSGEDKDGNPIAIALAQITKSTVTTLANSTSAENKAHRLREQAENREAKVRRDLETAIDAQDDLRKDLHIAKITAAAANAAKEDAETRCAAALADLEEYKRQGGAMKEPFAAGASRFVERAYEVYCKHTGEEPTALEKEEWREACEAVVAFLLTKRIPYKADNPEVTAMLALRLHYGFGLPWAPLRVIIFNTYGVDMPEPPGEDWVPPTIPDEEPEPVTVTEAGETVH